MCMVVFFVFAHESQSPTSMLYTGPCAFARAVDAGRDPLTRSPACLRVPVTSEI